MADFKTFTFQKSGISKIFGDLKIVAFQNREFESWIQDFGWFQDFGFPMCWIQDFGWLQDFLAFQNTDFKILGHLKILALKNHKFKSFADFKILAF